MSSALLAGLLLVSASSVTYELAPAGICAKDLASCEAAIDAVRRGWLWPDLARRDLRCAPHPGCFSARSECIAGYNCERGTR